MTVQKNYMLKVAAAAIIVIVIVASYIIYNASRPRFIIRPPTTTVGANLTSCNGYVISMSQPSSTSEVSCTWRGGIVNITLNGGRFTSIKLQVERLNATPQSIAVYNGSTCKPTSGGYYMPLSNYKLSVTTGPASTGSSCGNATVRLSAG